MSAPETGACSAQRPRYAVQIHPSLRCNLSCPHCYSQSGPAVRTGLDVQTVLDVIADAAALGYEIVSFSGGEPLMYAGLADACAFAKSLGLTVTIVTNGFFLDARHLDPLAGFVDGLAISLDGDAALHNTMRGSSLAHDRVLHGLDAVRSRGIPFGFIHALTAQSWAHLEALVEFAAHEGAELFQIHPLEAQGRAADWDADAGANDTTLAKVYVLTRLLNAQYRGKPNVSFDAAPTSTLVDHPELIYGDDGAPAGSAPGLLRNLIVEADGTVVPFTYGLAREFAIGNVTQSRLHEAVPTFLASERYGALKDLCRRVHTSLAAAGTPPLTNWYEVLRRESRRDGEATSYGAAGVLVK